MRFCWYVRSTGLQDRDGDMLSDGVLQAEHLDISKARATELLKANDADPVKAMRAWVAA
jgi:hypothetical protein